MEEILKHLPFNTYSDLFNAVLNGKAMINILRSECMQIASIKHPYSNFRAYEGIIIAAILLLVLSIKFSYYSILVLIPFNIFLTAIIAYLPILKKISWFVIVIDLFIIKLPFFFLIASINTLIISFFYNMWWRKIYRYAIYELQFNEDAFLWAWDRCGITIVDCYGNTYSKLNVKSSAII